MLEVTFQAVSKVIVAVLIGAFSCKWIPYKTTTIRDFSFLISNVLLPSLTVTNTAQSVNADVLRQCSILLVFAVAVIFVGIGCAIVMAFFLFPHPRGKAGVPAELEKDVRLDLFFDKPEDTAPARGPADASRPDAPHHGGSSKKTSSGVPYTAVILSPRLREMGVGGHDIVAQLEVPSMEMEKLPFHYWGAWVGCSIQNTVTLPLSLLQNLAESVEWIDFKSGTAYIFVYSIVVSLYIWAVGPFYVERAQKQTTKRRLIREIITTHKKMLGCADAMTQTDISYLASRPPLVSAGPSALPPPPPSTTSGAASTFTVPASASMASARRALTKYQEDADHVEEQQQPLAREGGATAAADDTMTSPLSLESIVPVVSLDKSEPSTTTSRATSPPPEMADAEEQTMEAVWTPRTRLQHQLPLLGCAEQIPYDWEAAGRIRVKYADQLKAAEDGLSPARVLSSLKALGFRLLGSLSFMSVVVGIFIGVVTPVHNLFYDGGPLEIITDAVTLIGQGNIPAALLLLGANLVGSMGADTNVANLMVRNSEQNTDFPLVPADDRELLGEAGKYAQWYNLNHEQMEFDEHASFSLQTYMQQQSAERIAEARAKLQAEARARAAAEADDEVGADKSGEEKSAGTVLDDVAQRPAHVDADEDEPKKESAVAKAMVALSLHGVSKRFVWGIIVERLVIAPIVGFVILIAVARVLPSLFSRNGTIDQTLLVVLFMELATPTAINSALLFNQRDYMTYPWAKMLFFQYLLTALTMVMWTTVGLNYVEKYT